MENDVILEFKNFNFQYNAQAEPTLYDINLKLHAGEKLLITGPSGCGKSTLAHCVNGLIPFSYKGNMSGSLQLNGKETRGMSLFEISKTVGTVLQDTDGQFVGLTVAEDIAFAAENDCVETEEMHARVRKVAETVGLEAFLHHAPGNLSGGQKQRVSLAGILMDDVKVFLFDEPLANLDPATGKQAIELIEEIRRNTGAAVIIIEHRIEEALHAYADRVVVMENGRILADCPPEELLCTDLLAKTGLREPLYLTALRYAGVQPRPEMKPWSIETLEPGEKASAQLNAWFRSTPPVPPAEEKPVILEAEGLEFTYANGCRALKGVSLKVREGEMLAVVGTNGAGKSTLSKVICGFEKQQKGSLRFRGEEMDSLSIKERAERIGYVMQNPNQMISKILIFDEVALGLRTRGIPEEEIRSRVENALKVCGLWRMRSWPVSALSYGQKKRVTIAAILVLRPQVMILDEPTAGQDYRHYTEIMEFLTELNRQGLTVIMITHDMHLMQEYASRAVAFSEGRILADGSCADILTDPEIAAKASLRETSLYTLAERCGIADRREFVRRFIAYEREARNP